MRNPILYSYLADRCNGVPDYLHQVERNTYLKSLSPQMLSGTMQGRFLAWLTSWLKPKRILEVGTFTGYSALCMAEGLSKDGCIDTIEINDELEKLIKEHFALSPFEDQLNLYIGDANQIIPQIKGPWDLVFLDAKKDDYPAQFEMIANYLAPGGHIVLDNILWNGLVLDPNPKKEITKLLQKFTQDIANDPMWETLAIPLRDGLFIVRKKS